MVRPVTDARRSGIKDVTQLITELNPVLRGWGNYFRTGNAERKFNQMDSYVYERLCHWMYRRGGQRGPRRLLNWDAQRFYGMGLYELKATGRYPPQAAPRQIAGQPYAGNPHVRLERGFVKTGSR